MCYRALWKDLSKVSFLSSAPSCVHLHLLASTMSSASSISSVEPSSSITGAGEEMRIAELKPGMKNLNCTFIVLQRGATTKTKDGNTVVQYLVADASGSIQASFWDEKAEALQPGDIFRIRGGCVPCFQRPMFPLLDLY